MHIAHITCICKCTKVTPVFLKQYATGSAPYRIAAIWSTASDIEIPNASRPGDETTDVVQGMDADLIVFLMENRTKVCK